METNELVKKFEKLRADRQLWESHWQECSDYILPRKNDILRVQTPGNKRGVELYDSTAVQANELLSGALHGLLTNPSEIWFELTTGEPELDEKDDIRKWLQKCAFKMHNVLNNSNFQTEIHEVYLDEGCFGTAALAMEEDEERVIRFATRQISEIFVEEDNKGVIDTVFRIFKWTPRQIVLEFGEKNVGKTVKELYQAKSNDKLDILHCVYPRDPGEQKDKKGPKSYPFCSRYILIKDAFELKEGGFREFPYAVPRWTKSSGEVYGRSPGMKALADIKMINEVMKTTIRGAQKTVDPPLMLPDDGFVLPLKTTPGGLNYYRAGTQERIETFANDAKVDFGYQVMEDIRKRIREAYFVDQLQLNQGPQMTATEVMQRTEEKMRLMGPVLGRQQSELLRPLIDRLFGIMFRRKLLPDPIPEALSGMKIDVRYSSMIAKSQRTSEAQNFARTWQAVEPLGQIQPQIWDNVNGDKTFRYIAKMYGWPQETLNDLKEVDKSRQQRAQQQQQMQQQQQEAHAADQIQKVAPAAIQAKEAGMI